MKSATDILLDNRDKYHPVVSFNPATEKLLLMDFTTNNKQLPDELFSDTPLFTNYVNDKLRSATAKFGIGGYNEHRELYARSKVFDPLPGEEPRRLHLGIDIWGRPYSIVTAPLHAVVHSFAFNSRFGDYGTTLILTHNLNGFSFYTLYGHLSLNSIKNLQEGDNIDSGDVIGEFGIPIENGHWPPHLHFQIILDLENWNGDYPGVCKLSEAPKYLDNCPNPDLILQMMQFAQTHQSE